MANYLIIRHGANTHNDSGPLTIVQAKNRREANGKAPIGETYNNQWLESIPVSRARASDLRIAYERDALLVANRASCHHAYEYGICAYCGAKQGSGA